jgi:hypothetical protein
MKHQKTRSVREHIIKMRDIVAWLKMRENSKDYKFYCPSYTLRIAEARNANYKK